MHDRFTRNRDGWTIVELLIVLSIIAVLIGILMPVIVSARRQAALLKCQANLSALGHALHAYAAENGGWLYPVDNDPVTGQPRDAFGTQAPPHARWPAIVFKISVSPLPYDPASYTPMPYDPVNFPPEPFTPSILLCPRDGDDALEAHTYVLNGHLGQRGFRLGNKDLAGRTSDQVPAKRSPENETTTCRTTTSTAAS